jgi:hypothetical protein
MALNVRAGEQYVIRRKVLKLAGAAFHVFDASGAVVAYCKQKAFKLREDLRLFTDESMTTPLLRMQAREVIDFGATYDVTLPDGSQIGSLRRKGLRSSFVRDEWLVYNAEGREIAAVRELGSFAPFARRFIDYAALFLPQKYDVTRTGDGQVLATFRQHANLFVFRMSVAILADDPELDELILLAAGCLIAAIEGRQA